MADFRRPSDQTINPLKPLIKAKGKPLLSDLHRANNE